MATKKKTTDDMSFGKAFAYFRKKHGGKGGRFKWKGKTYTTDLKSEVAKPKAKPKGKPSKVAARKRTVKPAAKRKTTGAKRKAPAKPEAPSVGKSPAKKRKAPSVQSSVRKAAATQTIMGLLGADSAKKAKALKAKQRRTKQKKAASIK